MVESVCRVEESLSLEPAEPLFRKADIRKKLIQSQNLIHGGKKRLSIRFV